jgi:hypothetical protein
LGAIVSSSGPLPTHARMRNDQPGSFAKCVREAAAHDRRDYKRWRTGAEQDEPECLTHCHNRAAAERVIKEKAPCRGRQGTNAFWLPIGCIPRSSALVFLIFIGIGGKQSGLTTVVYVSRCLLRCCYTRLGTRWWRGRTAMRARDRDVPHRWGVAPGASQPQHGSLSSR